MSSFNRVLALAGFVLLTPEPAAAVQQGKGGLTTSAILAMPVSRDRAIALGETRTSSLDGSDGLRDDDSLFEAWYFEGRAGQRVSFTMRSSTFDTYLLVGRQGASAHIDSDDDGGGGTDSQIESTLPADGWYVIIANSLSGGTTGAFTLSVATGTATSAAAGSMTNAQILRMQPTTARRIAVGQTQVSRMASTHARMSDNTPFEAWFLEGRAGERVTVTVRSSDFDSFLHVGRQGEDSTIESDDDSAGDLDSRITLTLPASGTYVLIANTVGSDDEGAYTIEVTGGASTGATTYTQSQAFALPVASARRIAMGETRASRLGSTNPMMSDYTPFETWYIEGRAGERVTITMRSTDFDSYLRIGALGSTASLASDDDSGGNLDSQVTVTLPANGVYVIIANTLSEGQSGAYTMTVLRAN